MPVGRLLSVNVGRPAELRTPKRTVLSSIVKRPADGPVAGHGCNLDGDEQADRANHGGFSKAVYAYARATAGLDLTSARIGDRWRIGTLELRVTGPRVPCFKLAALMEDPGFVRRFVRAGRPGAYLSIARAGELCAGDPIEIIGRPEHEVTVGMVATATLVDPSLLPALEPARADFTPQLAAWVASRTPAARL